MAWTWSSRCQAKSWPAGGIGQKVLRSSTCNRLVDSRRIRKVAAIANLAAAAAIMLGSYRPAGEPAALAALVPAGDMMPWAAMLATCAMASMLLFVAGYERSQQADVQGGSDAALAAGGSVAVVKLDEGSDIGADRAVPFTGLMANMSHDLRTPLNAIIGFSDIMQQELHGPLGSERYQSYAGHIRESGVSLLEAIEKTLALTEQLAVEDRPGRAGRLPGSQSGH